jgi:hypothetical protein
MEKTVASWVQIVWGLHLVLPIYGLLVLMHYRTYKQNQRVLNDSLHALQLLQIRNGVKRHAQSNVIHINR